MKYWLIALLFSVAVFGCKKATESPSSLGLADITSYCPMKLGKVFIYRMDSSNAVLGNFVTSHYLAKDSVVNTFVDNQGRTCYLIFRYLTDTLVSQPYQYNQSYYVAYDKNKIEFVDANNRRFINLVNPVSTYTTWYGNSQIDSLQISQNTSFAGWQYQYTTVNQPYTVFDSTFPNTVTILQNADSSSVIPSETYSTEVYAQGVGLIYKQIIDYFYQSSGVEDGCFELTLNLVSYK